jgi:membrane protein DedA with SNARE-associated domain/rhodanese-related sulfurtransferase
VLVNDPLAFVARHGVLFVFANVLVEQLGVPVPAVPTLIVAGALAADGKVSGAAILAAAVIASVLADGAWYIAGRRYGLGILRLLCRISLSPDSCVRQTENHFARWGIFALIFGKFVPGMATIGPPLAGATGIGAARFLAYTTLGGLIWVGVMFGAGVAFHTQITVLLDRFEALGTAALAIVAALLALFIAAKWWERRRFYRTLRLARITAKELRSLMDDGKQPVVVDVRSLVDREADGRYIPGALAIDLGEIDRRHGELPDEREIVFYCSCPNEASAAVAAKRLMTLGYSRVRPLLGGLEGWVEAGYAVERRASR